MTSHLSLNSFSFSLSDVKIFNFIPVCRHLDYDILSSIIGDLNGTCLVFIFWRGYFKLYFDSPHAAILNIAIVQLRGIVDKLSQKSASLIGREVARIG